MGRAPLGRYRGEVRCGQQDPRGFKTAVRAFARHIVLGHRPRLGKGAALGTQIVVDGHQSLPVSFIDVWGRGPAVPQSRRRSYLSGDIGISTPGMTCLVGPAALGMTSKSKISVGSHSVAQAFGISTTPEMCP